MASSTSDQPAAFEFNNISKSFGQVLANDNVSFSVPHGAIHAVVGENGAGKSTIMKILFGMFPPSQGQVMVQGKKVHFKSPLEALAHQIGMVHQHFMLVPTLTVWENLILGSEPSCLLGKREALFKQLETMQESFGFKLPLQAVVEDLCVGEQQRLEILKMLYRKAETLILDEPTAVLTPQEVDELFKKLRHLRDQGKTIVLITHKLREVLSLCDSLTVMRRGKVVEPYLQTQGMDESTLAELIVGRKLKSLPERHQHEPKPCVLETRNLSLTQEEGTCLSDINLQIRPGEVLGVAGIEGNGQQEIMEVLSNVQKDYQGEVLFHQKPLRQWNTYDSHQLGMAVIPPDRHQEALVLDFPAWENFLLGHHQEACFTSGSWILRQKCLEMVGKQMGEFDVRPQDPKLPIRHFSGGNQQKLIIARELFQSVSLLLAAHPTRGVDVGAIEFIHELILQRREQGMATLLISSELDEILALSDRIMVLFEGKIVGEVSRENATKKLLGQWMTGQSVKG